MKTTLEYLEDARQTLNVRSDNALANKLGIARNSMSQYRSGRRTIDNYAAVKIAETLGVPPIQIIAAANAEREKDDRKKSFWQEMAKNAAMGIFALGIGGAVIEDVRAEINRGPEYLLCARRRQSRRWAGAA